MTIIERKIKRSITVEFWNAVFFALSYISIFKYIRLLIEWISGLFSKKDKIDWYRVVDIWVLFNFFFSFASVFLIKYICHGNIFEKLIVYYGLLRVFEIIIYQINVLLFDEYRSLKKKQCYKIRSSRRMIVNLLTNFAEIVFWFAASYCFYWCTHIQVGEVPSAARLLLTSFSHTTTFGVSALQSLDSATTVGAILLCFQCLSGMIMTLLSLCRFINILPPVESIDEYEIRKPD